jgi:glycosyltransferase involved in cell wall biosynthesis
MRIAFLSYQWPGMRTGGIGSYVQQSAAALALAGHEPHVFTVGLTDSLPTNVPDGVVCHLTPDHAQRLINGDLSGELSAVLNCGGEGVYRLAIAWLLTDAFRREHRLRRFDVVEVADVDACGLPLLLGDRTLPVIVHLHTCSAIANRIHKKNLSANDKLIEALEAAQIHLADAVCAPTDAVVQETRALADNTSSEALRSGGSDGEEHGSLAYFRDRGLLGKVAHPFVCPAQEFIAPRIDGPVLFVGRLEWRKGCGVLAEMLGHFLQQNPTARFRFVGSDTSSSPDGRSVQNHILNHLHEALRDRVEFTGELSALQVTDALHDCSFCVLPSLSENFSLAICEAMAAGRTTIVAAGTGSVELLGDAGVAVKAGSADALLMAMDTLYRDRPRLNQLSRQAFDRVRTHCDPIAISKQRVDFYRQAINEFETRSDRLTTLPVGIAAVVLPCLSRMTAALMRIDEPNDSPGIRLNSIFQKLKQGKPAQVLLYGAGKHTARLLSERHRWERHGHRVVGLIDDHARFAASPIYLGLPVRSLADTGAACELTVVLSTDTHEQQFWERTRSLRESGVRVFKLYGS